MDYIRLGRIEEFPENTARLLSLPDGSPVLLINLEGEFHALEGACCGGNRLEGTVVVAGEGKVLCPTHGWEIDLAKGVCLAEPDSLLKRYPVRLQGQDILIGCG